MQVSRDGKIHFHDRKAIFKEFSVGDIVSLHNVIRKHGLILTFQRPWKGTYVNGEKLNDILYKYKKHHGVIQK